jgi:hypothetical protein
MQLLNINDENIQTMLRQHDADGGNSINDSLSKLFSSLSDEKNRYEVSIKVAALNQIYSTAIQYITPVVEKIFSEIDNSHTSYSSEQYVASVDKISTVSWVSPTTSKSHTRCNMSFSSKYVHFLSGRKLPIYDSYIWIVMVGYMNSSISFAAPKTYAQFYDVFCKFKEEYKLCSYSNYEIDKYLWQYGKNLINEIIRGKNVGLDKAKAELKASITRRSSLIV